MREMKEYKGEAILTKKQADNYKVDPYLPSPKLIEAVRLAQILKRPLLVKGEPGCGKSRLAEAIAIELHGKNYKEFFFEWNIKSTSKAQDGLYFIDHLHRLSEANMREKSSEDLKISLIEDKEKHIYKSEGKFISLREIGNAFESSKREDCKESPVILIDEIDKADIDFPNDLLIELEKMEFKIPEIKDGQGETQKITANPDNKPLIIITSNDERPLPPAFLRRCLFHYIDIKDINLEQIIATKFPTLAGVDELIPSAVGAFTKWRDKIKASGTGLKNISTSELIDWFKLLDHTNFKGVIDAEKIPPFPETLLKDVESLKIFAKASL